MKKIILSLLMLCTAVSAWSYTEQTVTKTYQQSRNGMINCDDFMIVGTLDKTTGAWTKGLAVYSIKSGCVITSVEFGMRSGSIDKCESTNGKWKFDSTTGKWVQDGTFAYDENVPFSSTSSCLIESVTITYHKHVLTLNEGVAATCSETGIADTWTCSDCEHRYLDEAGASEVVNEEDLILQIDPTNHEVDLKEVGYKNASVSEEGVYRHWHCDACGNDYADAYGTENITGKTAKAKYDADALLIGNTTLDESYLFDGAKVTFDGDHVNLSIGSDVHEYELSKTERLLINFSHTFKLKANADPDSDGDYYATFYTSEGAYKMPESAEAYTGKVETTSDPDVDALRMTAVNGLVRNGEAVVVKASQSDVTLMPSVNTEASAADNAFEGTDEQITLGANQYALTLGQNGVGFYLWEGKEIAGNKAYLTLDASSQAKALVFIFDDPTVDSINDIQRSDNSGNDVMYNLSGLRVDKSYKGIVIKNGKKYLNR